MSNPAENYLRSHGIAYVRHEHPPVFTCEEAQIHASHIPGTLCKNLFLRDKKGKRLFLIVLPDHKRADLTSIGRMLGENKIRFASPETLREKLSVEPGSVSPLGLIHDIHQEIEVYIDQEVYDAELINIHPNDNTASLEITRDMFRAYLTSLSHEIHVVSM